MDWEQLKKKAVIDCVYKKLSTEYIDRIKFEVREIEKQGLNQYWVDAFVENKKWDVNPNGLVFPWILGMTPIDPIRDNIKHNISYQTDFPDIDLDFLPLARATIKEFASKKYGHVCSVGNWNTYKPKSALQDVARVTNQDLKEVMKLTTSLPDEFDDLTLDDHDKIFKNLKDPDAKVRQEAHMEHEKYRAFYEFKEKYPDLCDTAFRLVGKIKSQGTHAGGVIIADRPIEDIVPLSFTSGNWVSQWTEGKSTQLSKFGLVKYDILGLKTIFYIWQCGETIKRERGISIDWSRMDPTADPPRAGFEIHPDGSEKIILLNDPDALKMCNDLRTESVFQIETPIQKGIIQKGKVQDFWDLVVYNALGRPGPMDMIPHYIKRRDDKTLSWKKNVDERITKILSETYNVIVYQEQLQAMWIRLANFSVPEAEAARKIIAKKWKDKLPQVEKKWKDGATKQLGEQSADDWWKLMIDFGRYAFNRAHSVAYSLITYRCLYLKSHYPAEWWAAVMSECHQDKLKMYMGAAKLDGVQFGSLDINNLSRTFSVRNNTIIPGMQSMKGIGEKASIEWSSRKKKFGDIDQVVKEFGRSKVIFERLIKLGAFEKIHPNRQGLWVWYQYKYCNNADVTDLRKEVNSKFLPSDEELQKIREMKIQNFQTLYPKKKKLPKSVTNWMPAVGYNCEVPSRDQVINLYNDFTDIEKLQIEKDLLGYYWSNPLSVFMTSGNCTIENAKQQVMEKKIQKPPSIEVVIENIVKKRAKTTGNVFYIFSVTDGIQNVDITIWKDVVNGTDKAILKPGRGVKMMVDYNIERNSFKIASESQIISLEKKGEKFDNMSESEKGIRPPEFRNVDFALI
jgi:DNA polymerase-3 subunit alpha